MKRTFLRMVPVLLLLGSLVVPGRGNDYAPLPTRNKKLQQAVPKVSAVVEPATAKPGETVTWKLTVELAPGWHTYPTTQPEEKAEQYTDKITFPKLDGVEFAGPLQEPECKSKAEPAEEIKELRYCEGKATWQRSLKVSPDAKPGKLTIPVTMQMLVCDKSKCLPAEEFTFEATLTIAGDKAAAPPPAPADDKSPPKAAVSPSPAPTATPPAPKKDDQGLLAFVLSGILWGAISLLTPCVFPMIPITVSFFLKQSEKEHHRPLGMALVYSLTIVTVLTLGAVLLLGFFQAASQHWLTNLVLGGLFVFFALSLFGMYDISLPSGLANYTSSQQGRGGLVGTVFMALTFSIISFSCVAPFLGGFAALVPSFGNVTEMIKGGHLSQLVQVFGKLLLGALAFAVTFASPFFVLALFPSLLRKLPKSGSWMTTVKVVMGFLELAAAVKFFRASELLGFGQAQLLSYDLALGLYVALSLLCGLYLLGLFRLPHDEPPEHLGVPRMVVAGLFLALALYLAPGLLKVNADQRQRPGGSVFAWLDSFLLPDKTDKHLGNLAEALQESKDKRKLVFVNFTGVG